MARPKILSLQDAIVQAFTDHLISNTTSKTRKHIFVHLIICLDGSLPYLLTIVTTVVRDQTRHSKLKPQSRPQQQIHCLLHNF